MPFGATTKMDGCAAVYPALSAIFVAQFFGLHLGIVDYVLIAFVSVLVFLLLFVMGLFLWASAAADARRTALALRDGRVGDAVRTWFFRI